MKKMTKQDALASFRESWSGLLSVEPQWRGDTTAKREAWNNYTDSLCKDGSITSRQYDTWQNPF